MGITAEKLAARLAAEKEKTLAFFNTLPDELWDKKLYADGAEWSVREVLAHIIEAEGSLARLFVHVAEGGSGVGEDFDIDQYNKSAVEKLHDVSVTDLLARFVALREQLILTIQDWSDDQFQNVGRHPFLGEARLDEMIRLFYLHVNLHMRDIRKMEQG